MLRRCRPMVIHVICIVLVALTGCGDVTITVHRKAPVADAGHPARSMDGGLASEHGSVDVAIPTSTASVPPLATLIATSTRQPTATDALPTIEPTVTPMPLPMPVARALSRAGIDVVWETVPHGADGPFSIERAEGDGPWAEIGAVPLGITRYVDEGLTCGTTYRYRLRPRRNMPMVSAVAEGITHPCGAITLVVTSTLSSGAGTLRQALLDALMGDTIVFDPDVFFPQRPATIALDVDLPEITQGNLTLDASNAGVVIVGEGLTIASDGNRIMGLHLEGNRSFSKGISLVEGAEANTIGGDAPGQANVIVGYHYAIAIDVGSQRNRIVGNLIGTAAQGAPGLGNDAAGVAIMAGSQHNLVERNVISGAHGENVGVGVLLIGEGTDHNRVVGNLIGTDATGSLAIPSWGPGVAIGEGASENTIGGTRPDERNVIASSQHISGVYLYGEGTEDNVIIGNYIGTDMAGTRALPNVRGGVFVANGAARNRIGGSAPGEGNLISGNGGGQHWAPGVLIQNAHENVVMGNRIGVDAHGAPLYNPTGPGICLVIEASGNIIGGQALGEGNTIAGEKGRGIEEREGARDNVIVGNAIDARLEDATR